MGQTLSEPVTQKHTRYGEDERFAYGVSEMQGWRLTMEDAHAVILDLDREGKDSALSGSEVKPPSAGSGKNSFFAVYDGHGGASVAKFAGDTVHYRLRDSAAYRENDYTAALKHAFLETDVALRDHDDLKFDPSGCTAVAALVTYDGRIIVANAGDSRSVLSVNGAAKPMSFDHKPVNREETQRITAAGGYVDFGRVNGNLALSRALGDFEFKKNKDLSPEKQVVTADPDILTHQTTQEDEFLVMACDGIWDVLSNQQAVDFIRHAIAQRTPLQEIAEQLIDRCLAPDLDFGGVGCDNMTLMIIGLFNGRTKEEWYDTIAKRVEKGEGYATPNTFEDPFTTGPRAAAALSPPRPAISTAGLPANLINAMIQAGILRQEDVDKENAERDAPGQNTERQLNANSSAIMGSPPTNGDNDDDDHDDTDTPPASSVCSSTPVSSPPGITEKVPEVRGITKVAAKDC